MDKKQGSIYVEREADKWFERNKTTRHNCFTEYLVKIFPRIELLKYNVAEFGVGRANNIRFLSSYVSKIHGYDGSRKSIEKIKQLKQQNSNIDGKLVNLGKKFETFLQYDLIIFGFFVYMLSNDEFDTLLSTTKKALKSNGYIFIYDFLVKDNIKKQDKYNKDLFVYKRNLNFYLNKLEDYKLIDFRLWDNKKLSEYFLQDKIYVIDKDIDSDDYNHTFSALFKRG